VKQLFGETSKLVQVARGLVAAAPASGYAVAALARSAPVHGGIGAAERLNIISSSVNAIPQKR
jgi:hypothetical protein